MGLESTPLVKGRGLYYSNSPKARGKAEAAAAVVMLPLLSLPRKRRRVVFMAIAPVVVGTSAILAGTHSKLDPLAELFREHTIASFAAL